MLTLVEDAAQVFSDDTQRKQLCATKKEHDHHDGRITAYYLSEEYRVEQDIHHIAERT